MDRYLNVKFLMGNNEELSGHFILIVNKRLVVYLGKRNFSQSWNVVTPHKIISAYKWPAVKWPSSFYCFIFFYIYIYKCFISVWTRKEKKTYIGPLKKKLQITTACTLIYFISFFLRLLFLEMFVTSHLVLFACSRKKFRNSSNEREGKVYFFSPLFVSLCFYTMLASTCLSFSYSQQWQDSRTAQQLAKKNDNDTSLKKIS